MLLPHQRNAAKFTYTPLPTSPFPHTQQPWQVPNSSFQPSSFAPLPIAYGGRFVPQHTGGNNFNQNQPRVVDPFAPNNDPIIQAQNLQQRLSHAGIEAPERKTPGLGSLLLGALDTMNRGQHAVTNAVLEMQRPEEHEGGVGAAIIRGLRGKQRSSTTDIFDNMGWENDPNQKWHQGQNLVRNVAGFAGDVLLDPTTYLSAGTSTFGKGAAKAASKGAISKVALGNVDEVAGRVAHTLSTSVDDVMRRASKHGENANFILETAQRLGRNNIEDTRKLLDVGLDAISPDALANFKKIARGETAEAQKFVDILGKSRKGSQANYFGGEQLFGKKSNFNINEMPFETQRGFAEGMDIALGSSPQYSSIDAKRNVLKKVLEADYISDDLLNIYNDRELRMLDTLFDTFGGFGDAGYRGATEAVANFASKRGLKDFVGDASTLDPLLSKFRKEAKARVIRDTAYEGVEFANGLQHVYRKATQSYHVRFMGKDLFDFTNTVGKRIGYVFDKAIGITPIRKATDALGYLFQPEHISQAIKLGDPKQYQAMKEVAQEVSKYLSRETGAPHEALNAVINAFNPAFYSNKKLPKAAAIYIEGFLVKDADEHAVAMWNQIAPTLNDVDMRLIKEAVATNAILNEAFNLFDVSRGVKMNKELAEKVAKEGGLNIDTYLKHLYENDTDSIDKIMRARNVKGAEKSMFRMDADHFYGRSYRSMAEAEALSGGALKAKYDLMASASVRYLDSLRVGLNREMEASLLSMAKEVPALKGLISSHEVAGLKKIANMSVWVDPEIMHQMKRVMDLPMNNQGAKYFLDVFDKYTNMLKTLQTSASPAFILRNLVGETLMNWFARVGVDAHVKASNILKDAGEHKITQVGDTVLLNGETFLRKRPDGWVEHGSKWVDVLASKEGRWGNAKNLKAAGIDFETYLQEALEKVGVPMYDIGGKKMSAFDIMKIFSDGGLSWSGVTKGNLIRNMGQVLDKELIRKSGKNPVRKLLGSGQELGDFTEKWTRMAHLIDRLDNGYGLSDAIADVKKFHVDYRHLTVTEKEVFRRLAPYYTFMRKNVPIQLRTLLTEPGKVNAIFHLVRSSTEALKRDNGGEEVLTPDFLKEGMALPISMDDDGNVRYLNWNLPLTDLARLNWNLGEMAKMNSIDMLHPFLKMPFEMASGRNLHFGSEIQKYEGQRAPLFPGWEGSPRGLPQRLDYAFQQTGLPETIRRSVGQALGKHFDAPEERNPYRPDQLPLIQSLLPLRNQQQTEWQQAFDHRDQLQEYVRFLKEEKGIEIPALPHTKKRPFKPQTIPLPSRRR